MLGRSIPYRLIVQTAVCAALLSLMVPALSSAAEPPSTVTVSGQGTISRDPDRATLTLSVVTNNDAAATATSQNNVIYNALVGRLRGVGLAESAIHTRSYSVSYVAKPEPNAPYKPPRTGYVVTRALGVSIDNLTLVGRAIDAAVAAGIPEIDGVAYGLRDQRSAYNAALAAAVQDAQAQATAIAQAAHLHLGAIRTIAAGGNAIPQPVFRAMAVQVAPVPTEISPSQVEIQASVRVTFLVTP